MNKFMTFDPFLSFAENEKGVKEKAFFKKDGSRTYTRSWGSDETPDFWYTGRKVYAVVAAKVGFQPEIDDFLGWLEEIFQLEQQLLPAFQAGIDMGALICQSESEGVPITDLAAEAQDSIEGHVIIYGAKIIRQMIIGGDSPDSFPDFELLLSILAVIHIDDCIIADQLQMNFEDSLNTFQTCVIGAASYKETLEVMKATTINRARKAGQERHRESQEVKKTVIDEWCKQKGEYNSRADFVRIRSTAFGVKERTLDKWIADHEKESRKRTTGS